MSGGLKLTTDVADEAEAAPGAEPVRRAVAPKNEALLRSQSDELYQEYISGGWAHPSPVEAGGLMMRMPLPAQLLSQMRDGSSDYWPAKLREKIQAELPEAAEGEVRTSAEREALMATFTSNTMYCYRVAETMMEERTLTLTLTLALALALTLTLTLTLTRTTPPGEQLGGAPARPDLQRHADERRPRAQARAARAAQSAAGRPQ